MSKNKNILSENDSEFNEFVATEDDLKQITNNIQINTQEDKVNIEPIQVKALLPSEAPKKETHNLEIETDYNYVRNNLYTITERSVEALNNLSEIANQSQHPRAFEVLSLLVKTIADAQRDLIAVHKEKVKIQTEKQQQEADGGPDIVNNNLFVGTTAQLDEIIAKMTKKKDA